MQTKFENEREIEIRGVKNANQEKKKIKMSEMNNLLKTKHKLCLQICLDGNEVF